MRTFRTSFLLATLAGLGTGGVSAQSFHHGGGHAHHHPPWGYGPSTDPVPIIVGIPIAPFAPMGTGWSPSMIFPSPQAFPAIPPPPGGDPPLPVARPLPPPRRTDPAKAEKLVRRGDNLLHAGILGRARERYQEAARVDFSSAIPKMRIAEIAMIGGHYAEAADGMREAQAADPRWLDHPRDIQPLFGDPSDFDAQLAKLETHLQAHPEDRDAWLLLGINRLLTGKSEVAADIFLRITGDKPDPTVSAFLAAARRLQPRN